MTERGEFLADRYWEERLGAHYDERGVGDIGMSRAYNQRLYAVRRRVFRRVANALPVRPADAAVFDVGSGTGVYIEEWLRWGAASVTGSDITRHAVDALTRRFPRERFVRLDIGAPRDESQPPLAEQYDVVSAFDVLFHIVDDAAYERALGNIAARLRSRGWFLYSDNLVEQSSGTIHYVSRPESFILGALERQGFRVVRRVPMFVFMNEPVRSRSRLLRGLFARSYRLAGRSERSGALLGNALFPLEWLATRVVRRGPSTEVLVCQRL